MKYFLTLFFVVCYHAGFTQTNSFPASGNVGIGTLTPSFKVQVDGGYVYSSTGFITPEYYWIGNGSVGYIRKLNNNIPLHFANAGGTPELTIGANGNIGIGETNPFYKLDVIGSIRGYSHFSTYTPDGLFSEQARPSGITTPSGDMRIRMGYLDQGGGQYWGRVGFLGNTNWSLGSSYGGHSFSIGRNYNGSDLLIDNAGNIGVGTVNPSNPLHVYGNATVGVRYQSASHAYMQVDGSASSQSGYYIFKNGQQKWGIYTAGNSNDLNFFDDLGDRVTFKHGGKVGIGTINPSTKLEVAQDNGKIRLSGGTYTSVDIIDGGTGDPGYIQTYSYGLLDNQIGAHGTYFAVLGGNVGIGTTNATKNSPSTATSVQKN